MPAIHAFGILPAAFGEVDVHTVGLYIALRNEQFYGLLYRRPGYATALATSMRWTASNIKDNRNDLDLLFGCLIDWGLPLSLPYTSEKIEGCTIHTYNDGDLIACFDNNIPESVIREIAKRKPLRAVFRDSGFADSPSKINVFEIFKLYMPEDADDISKRVRVI